MDIVLTKDGKFVVSHDFNLRRLANKNSYIYNLNLNEIVGIKTRQNGNVGRYVSFDEYVKKAKKLGQKLLVEVKLHGKEPKDMANIVVNKFKELGIEKEYMIVSLDLKLVEEIKKIMPEAQVGYIIPLLLGDLPDTNLDFYALEDFSYNESLAIQAKVKNKKLMIWTINDMIKIRKYLRQPIDGIITDELQELKEEKKYLKENNFTISLELQKKVGNDYNLVSDKLISVAGKTDNVDGVFNIDLNHGDNDLGLKFSESMNTGTYRLLIKVKKSNGSIIYEIPYSFIVRDDIKDD